MYVAALHRCGREGDVQACRVLLQYGVDPSIISLQGYTATQVSTDSVQRLLHGELQCIVLYILCKDTSCIYYFQNAWKIGLAWENKRGVKINLIVKTPLIGEPLKTFTSAPVTSSCPQKILSQYSN